MAALGANVGGLIGAPWLIPLLGLQDEPRVLYPILH